MWKLKLVVTSKLLSVNGLYPASRKMDVNKCCVYNSTTKWPAEKAIGSAVFRTMGVFVSILFAFAMTEMIIILLVYRRASKLHTLTNFWIVALISCDLVITGVAFPMLSVSSFSETLVFGDVGCQIDGFIVTSFGSISIYLLTGISVQRYWTMTKNYGFLNRNKRVHVSSFIALSFPLGTVWGALPLLGYGHFIPEGLGVSCAPDWKSPEYSSKIYIGLMFLFVFFIPLGIILFCYGSVLKKIWNSKINHQAQFTRRYTKRSIRVTWAIALATFSFLVAWTPYSVVNLAGTFFEFNAYNIHPMMVQIPSLVAKTACVWNPVIYVCVNGEFRKAVITYLRQIRQRPDIGQSSFHSLQLNDTNTTAL